MDIKPLFPEEIEYIKSTVTWTKILGSGNLFLFVVGLWKAFGIYTRIENIEKDVTSLKNAELLTVKTHDSITQTCQRDVAALVDKQVTALHIKWLEEMQDIRGEISEIKGTTCNISGKLDQLIAGKK